MIDWSNILEVLKYDKEHPLMFNSVLFVMLFSSFYLLYVIAFRQKFVRNLLLLLFSLYFYYKVSGFAVFLLVGMASSDYLLGLAIFYSKNSLFKRLFVLVSLLINLGCLAFFKYTNFVISSWNDYMHPGTDPVLMNILLPIGISFFVFKSLSYILDLGREMIDEPEKNYVSYLLYVSFFPNILAGPISKARNLLPQFKIIPEITREDAGKGLFLIATGLIKKVVLADFLAANFVDRVFDAPQFFTGFESLMAGYFAMVQIFCDFSGYTDIVIGLALILGFKVEPNFNKPFLAKNITDFWRRWHMTLASWLNEFLFYPMTFSMRRWKKFGVVIAVLITFFISGFWHGPNWTFVLWGLAHGVALAWDVVSEGMRDSMKKWVPKGFYNVLSIFITFQFLGLSVILFKSPDMNTAISMYTKIFTSLDFSLAGQWVTLYTLPFIVFLSALLLQYTPMSLNNWMTKVFAGTHWFIKAVLIALVFYLVYQVANTDAQPFVYLEF